MCIFEYNEEKAMQYIKKDEYDRGLEDGERTGFAKGECVGRLKSQKTFITNLLKKNTPDEQICEIVECDQSMIDEIRKLL